MIVDYLIIVIIYQKYSVDWEFVYHFGDFGHPCFCFRVHSAARERGRDEVRGDATGTRLSGVLVVARRRDARRQGAPESEEGVRS